MARRGDLSSYTARSTTPPFKAVLTHSHLDTFTWAPVAEDVHTHPVAVRLFFESCVGMGFPYVRETQRALQDVIDTFFGDRVFCSPNEEVAALLLQHLQGWIPGYALESRLRSRFNTVDFRLAGLEIVVDEADSHRAHAFHIDDLMTFQVFDRGEPRPGERGWRRRARWRRPHSPAGSSA